MNQKQIATLLILIFIQNLAIASCYQSTIIAPAPFLGNDGEIIKLSDNTIWEVHYEYNYMYQYYPSVTICPDTGILIIDDKKLHIQQLK